MLKIAAGAITGSVAIVTEAVHSSIDLLASVVAYVSLRKADEPADEDHLYGHAKVENVAAAIEGMLILVGAGVIVFEAVRRLATNGEIDNIGIGIAVIGLSAVVNLGVSSYLYRQARVHDSPALEGDAAHLRADAWTSFAVLIGLILIEVTGVAELDSIVALLVASAIVYAGIRILGARRACFSTRPCLRTSSTSSGTRSPRTGHPSCPATTSFVAGARAATLHRSAPAVRAGDLPRAGTCDRARGGRGGPPRPPGRRGARAHRARPAWVRALRLRTD